MRWPWSNAGSEVPNPQRIGFFRCRNRETGNRIDMVWEGDKTDARYEMAFRCESRSGKGIEFNGCPECGAFGHGMERHR